MPIVVEGYTEKIYFSQMRQALRMQNLSIEPKLSPKNDPLNIIETAEKEMNRADFDHVWCIFDSDTLSSATFREAMRKAQNSGIHIADSLPCFELWFLLHFRFTSRQYEKCSQVIHELHSHVEGYSKNQAWLKQKNMFSTYRDRIGKAIDNAKKLERFSTDNNLVHETTCEVFRIIEEIQRMYGDTLFSSA